MFIKRLFLIFVFAFELVAYGQGHELQAFYKFGFSTNTFHSVLYNDANSDIPDTDWSGARLLFDQTVELNYKINVWEKALVYFLGGMEMGQTKYYIPIINSNWYQIGDINFHQNKWSYVLGVAKQFSFYDGKVKLDLGFKLKDVYPFQRDVNFSEDWQFSDSRSWIEYKYSLDVNYRRSKGYYGKRIGVESFVRTESFVDLQFFLRDQWFLHFALSYQRNNFFMYNYTYDIRYYYGNSPYPNGFESYQGISGGCDCFFKNDDLIYTSLGVSYTFKNKAASKIPL